MFALRHVMNMEHGLALLTRPVPGRWLELSGFKLTAISLLRTASYLAKGVQSAQARHGQFPPQLFFHNRRYPAAPLQDCASEADFKRIGLRNYRGLPTSSGHPAIPIVPAQADSPVPVLPVEDVRLQPPASVQQRIRCANPGLRGRCGGRTVPMVFRV